MADPLVVVTAVGAGVAIAQPWVITAWKRFLRQGTIDVYKTGNIEVGFGNFGPTICLGGTLRAVHRDVFVSSIDVELVRLSDQLRHRFEWVAFRPHRVPLAPTGQEQLFLEIASGFMVSPNTPQRYNIVFADLDTRRGMDPLMGQTFEALRKVKEALGLENVAQQYRYGQEGAITAIMKLDEEYKKAPDQIDAYGRLTKICYWDVGRYRLTMTVRTTRPDKSFASTWDFELTDDDAKRLGWNVLNMVNAPLDVEFGLPAKPFYFAYPEYKEPSQA